MTFVDGPVTTPVAFLVLFLGLPALIMLVSTWIGRRK